MTLAVPAATVITVPKGRSLTVADLENLPDDGNRYELIDGILVVTPSPSHLHQRAALRLSHLLDDASRGTGLEALAAPFDVDLAIDTRFVPDVLVAVEAEIGPKRLETAPLLIVEILSPSTRRYDLALKRLAYAEFGVRHYWVVDPLAPSLVAYRLEEGEYAEVGRANGPEAFSATDPLAVTVIPSELVAPRR